MEGALKLGFKMYVKNKLHMMDANKGQKTNENEKHFRKFCIKKCLQRR